MSKRTTTKGIRFGFCASQNHDWCPSTLGAVPCNCWCHNEKDEADA